MACVCAGIFDIKSLHYELVALDFITASMHGILQNRHIFDTCAIFRPVFGWKKSVLTHFYYLDPKQTVALSQYAYQVNFDAPSHCKTSCFSSTSKYLTPLWSNFGDKPRHNENSERKTWILIKEKLSFSKQMNIRENYVYKSMPMNMTNRSVTLCVGRVYRAEFIAVWFLHTNWYQNVD